MDAIITSLLPYILGGALVPVQIIVVILLLTSERQGPLKASLFVTGMTLARLAQGVLFGLVLTGGSGDPADAQSSGAFKAGLLIALGIFLLTTAYKKWAAEPDPDAPPPKWLTMLDGITPARALLTGAGFILIAAKLWVFTLGAISTIGEAQLGRSSSITASCSTSCWRSRYCCCPSSSACSCPSGLPVGSAPSAAGCSSTTPASS